MTNLEMLKWGLNHIADNHGFSSSCENLEDEYQVCIYGITQHCDNNIPTYTDVVFLCEDLGIDKSNIYPSSFGIDIDVPEEWITDKGNQEFTGWELWKKENKK